MESPKVPMGWELHPLKRLISVASGSDVLDEVQESDSAIPVYGSGKGAFKYTSHNFSDSAAIIFGRKGSLGQPYIAKPPFWIVDTAYAATPTERSDFGFIYYSLLNFPWDPYITKTAKPSLVATEILGAKVAAPGVAEQRKVAAFLDTKTAEIDDVVDGLLRERELLERYKRELIAHIVTKGSNPDAPMKDSGLRYIGNCPAKWIDRPLFDLCDLVKSTNDDLATNTALQFKDGEIVQKPNWDNSMQSLEIIAKYTKVQEGMIVINGLNLNYDFNTKRIGLVREPGAITSAYIVLKPNRHVDARYLTYLLKAIDAQKAFHGMTEGVRKILNWKDIRRLMLPFPEYVEQQQIADFLDSKTAEIDGLIADLDRQVELLGRYRKQVINDVVTGKVRVGEKA